MGQATTPSGPTPASQGTFQGLPTQPDWTNAGTAQQTAGQPPITGTMVDPSNNFMGFDASLMGHSMPVLGGDGQPIVGQSNAITGSGQSTDLATQASGQQPGQMPSWLGSMMMPGGLGSGQMTASAGLGGSPGQQQMPNNLNSLFSAPTATGTGVLTQTSLADRQAAIDKAQGGATTYGGAGLTQTPLAQRQAAINTAQGGANRYGGSALSTPQVTRPQVKPQPRKVQPRRTK